MSVYKWLFISIGIISGIFMVLSKKKKIWIPSMVLYWVCVVIALFWGYEI